MARLRVRSKDNLHWIDVCYTHFFVRNAANSAWMRIAPNANVAVRNGDNTQWLQITCVDDDTDRCGGDPTDPVNQSICID